MSRTLIRGAGILTVALGMATLSVPAAARIVFEPAAKPAAAGTIPARADGVVPQAGHPNGLSGRGLPFFVGWWPAADGVPSACGLRSDAALRARVDRLFQQQQLTHTLARAHFWRAQR